MDKKTFQRPMRWLACAAFCAILLSGCALPGKAASAASQPGGAVEENMGAGTALDDGALRVLLGGNNSTATVFCGAQVIYTAPPHGSAYLLPDESTQATEYFVAAAPEGIDRYIRRVCDKTGVEIYACAMDEYPLGLCAGWLLTGISHQEQISGFSDCRLVQLSSGKTQALPDGTNQIFAISPKLYCVTGSVWSEDSSTQESAFAILYDADMQPIQTLADCTASRPYWAGGEFSENWLELRSNSAEGYACSYYNIGTKATLENANMACGTHFVSLNSADGACPVIDVDTGETVATTPYPCEAYLPAAGEALYYNSDTEYRDYVLHKDGTSEPLENYSVQESDGTAALLYADRLEVYDASGALLYTQALSALPEESSRYAAAFSGGRCLITQTLIGNSDVSRLPATLYGAKGILWENDSYYTVYQAYQQEYLLAERYTVGTNSLGSVSVTDILNLDGQPLVTGLRSVLGTSQGAVLPACKGFSEGWMDGEGNWLWKRSIWQIPADEGVLSYFQD